ncbi:hypothetical protein FPZ47_18110 [Mycobacterium helveticum]|uniref:Uncharacterized protein n=1 Tax=Mycobacterium helveticum TaxID=2592811 RepID=A0A557XKU4_9MYCO|nr:hypothetical protein FPZ47_18110 [Mycobacterium helveticum]TVS89685.1 hypothetical protein FPZ46_01900 [Mycobacterium helveticum]
MADTASGPQPAPRRLGVPTRGSANPALTIMALASRLAERVVRGDITAQTARLGARSGRRCRLRNIKNRNRLTRVDQQFRSPDACQPPAGQLRRVPQPAL